MSIKYNILILNGVNPFIGFTTGKNLDFFKIIPKPVLFDETNTNNYCQATLAYYLTDGFQKELSMEEYLFYFLEQDNHKYEAKFKPNLEVFLSMQKSTVNHLYNIDGTISKKHQGRENPEITSEYYLIPSDLNVFKEQGRLVKEFYDVHGVYQGKDWLVKNFGAVHSPDFTLMTENQICIESGYQIQSFLKKLIGHGNLTCSVEELNTVNAKRTVLTFMDGLLTKTVNKRKVG